MEAATSAYNSNIHNNSYPRFRTNYDPVLLLLPCATFLRHINCPNYTLPKFLRMTFCEIIFLGLLATPPVYEATGGALNYITDTLKRSYFCSASDFL